MSIVILSLEYEQHDKMKARIRHGDNEFCAFVNGDSGMLSGLLNKECLVEISFDNLISWQEIDGYIDEQSCIKKCESTKDAIKIQGRIHSIMDIDDGGQVFDLYLRNGPEYLAVTLEEFGENQLCEGAGIEVLLEGLCFYPTNT